MNKNEAQIFGKAYISDPTYGLDLGILHLNYLGHLQEVHLKEIYKFKPEFKKMENEWKVGKVLQPLFQRLTQKI